MSENKFGNLSPEHKGEWCARLRSGEYKQGIGVLRNKSDEYCCLGVLGDILAEETGYRWEKLSAGSYSLVDNEDESAFETAGLPERIRQLTGIEPLGSFVEGAVIEDYNDMKTINGHRALSSMNDSGDYSFADIADFIEKHF